MIKIWEGVKMRIAILGFGTVGSGVYEIAKTLKNIEVKKVLETNKAQRHIRGGYATKNKYALRSKN